MRPTKGGEVFRYLALILGTDEHSSSANKWRRAGNHHPATVSRICKLKVITVVCSFEFLQQNSKYCEVEDTCILSHQFLVYRGLTKISLFCSLSIPFQHRNRPQKPFSLHVNENRGGQASEVMYLFFKRLHISFI